MNFVALGEMVGKLSEKFRDMHDQIEWRKIYAFRNIIAHDYFGVDEEDVLGIIRKHLPKLKNELNQIIDGMVAENANDLKKRSQFRRSLFRSNYILCNSDLHFIILFPAFTGRKSN